MPFRNSILVNIFFLIMKRKLFLLAGPTKVKEEKKENSIRPKEEAKVKVEPRENGHSHKHKEKHRDRDRDRTKDRDHDKERDRDREKEKKREKDKEREKKKKIKVRVFLVNACLIAADLPFYDIVTNSWLFV
jgi:hypothetical protein